MPATLDEFAAELPLPPDGDSSGLRRDIADELADHLACAMQREQLVGSHDPETAWARVREKFGDPAAVARTLWRDALWGRIMAQRVLIGACLVMTAVCCAALFVGWQSLSRQQQLMSAMQASSDAQLKEQRELFTRLLKQSEASTAALAEQAKASALAVKNANQNLANAHPFSEWSPVDFRFVSLRADGPPAAGIKLKMYRSSSGEFVPNRESVSDAKGVVRFDHVRFGTYVVELSGPNGEYLHTDFAVQPGEEYRRTFLCPVQAPEFVRVNVHVAWPEDLAARSLWAGFRTEDVVARFGGDAWLPQHPNLMRKARDVLADPKGRIFAGYQHGPTFEYTAEDVPAPLAQVNHKDFSHREVTEGWNFPGGSYRIRDLGVLVPEYAHPSHRDGRTFYYAVSMDTLTWEYQMVAMMDKPGELTLVPTEAAVQLLRQKLREIDDFAKRHPSQRKVETSSAAN